MYLGSFPRKIPTQENQIDNLNQGSGQFSDVTSYERKSKGHDRHPQKEKRERMPCGGSFLARKTVGIVSLDHKERPELAAWMTAWGGDVFSVLLRRPEDIYKIDLDAISFIILADAEVADPKRSIREFMESVSARTAQRIRQANRDIPIVLVGEKLETTTFTTTSCPLYDSILRLPTTKTGLSLALSAASTNNLSDRAIDGSDGPSNQNRRPNIRPSTPLQQRSDGARFTTEGVCSSRMRKWSALCIFTAIALTTIGLLAS